MLNDKLRVLLTPLLSNNLLPVTLICEEYIFKTTKLIISVSLAFTVIGYRIFRGANSQKNDFRKNPDDPKVSCKYCFLEKNEHFILRLQQIQQEYECNNNLN